MRILPAIAVVLALSGCTDAGPSDYQVGGAFTAEPRPDWGEWEHLVSLYSDEPAAIMESFPEQFLVTGMTADGCNDFRAEALALAYVATVGDCKRG